MKIGSRKVRHEESGDFHFCEASSMMPTSGEIRDMLSQIELNQTSYLI
jgi:hypothetical protein